MRWFACLLLLLLPAGVALAQGDIHRCIGADGNPVFTDQRCVDVHATPMAAPPPSAASSVQPVPPQVPPAILCAASAADLKQAVVDAFAARDPNRMAGLMLWGGYGGGAVVTGIRELGQLMQYPLLDVEVQPASRPADGPLAFDGRAPLPVDSGPAPAADEVLVLHTAADDGSGQPREVRYALVRRSGCLWLQPQG